MTHDNPDSPLKPQVIDLEAEDVTMEETGTPETPPPPPVPPKKSTFPATWLAIAVLVGAIAGGWLYKDVLSSYLPSNELLTTQARIDALEAQGKTLGEQLASVAATSDQLKTEIQGATEKSSAAQTATAALETRLADLEAATQSAKAELEKLKSAPATGGTSSTPVDTSAVAALAQRLDALEKDVASLKTVSTPTDQSAATATLSQSLSDLKAKIAAGASYRAELERISRMVPAAAGLDTLSANANEGLPTAAGLAAELTALIPLLPKPEIASALIGKFLPRQFLGRHEERDHHPPHWRHRLAGPCREMRRPCRKRRSRPGHRKNRQGGRRKALGPYRLA